MAYTTLADIRTTCGIGSSEISDEDVRLLVIDAEKEVDQLMNTTFEPKRTIDFLDEYTQGCVHIFIKKYPITKINSITIDGTTVSPKYAKIYNGMRITLTSDAEETEWDPDEQANVIDYYYADMEETSLSTTTTSAYDAGDTSVVISSSSSIFKNDYIKIYGTDGYSEVTKVTAKSGTTLTVEALTVPHASGSLVVKMQVPQIVKRLTNIVTGLMMVARIVGESYKDIVGYTIEGLSVQKGEPYTQWRETAVQLRKEYDIILKHKRMKPAVA